MSIIMPLGRIESEDKKDKNFPMRAAATAPLTVTSRYWDKKPKTWVDQGKITCPLAETTKMTSAILSAFTD